jgi:hypothetical protein
VRTTNGVARVGVLGLLVALLFAGCADGESLSREQYVSKLNALCEDFSEKEKEIGDPQTLDDLVAKGPRILDAFDEAIRDKVGNLKAPDAIADEAHRLVDLANQQHKVIRELIDAAKDDNLVRVRVLASKNDALNNEATSMAGQLGAQACTQD